MAAAGSHPVDVSVDVELQHVGRIETRTSRLLRCHPLKAGGSKIDAVHEGLDEADRIVWPHIVVNNFRQK